MSAETTTPGWGSQNVNGDLHVENDLHVGGKLYAKRTESPYKGLFKSLEALKGKYPYPVVGDYADVGYDSTMRYVCEENGTWKESGVPGSSTAIDMSEYYDPKLISRIGFVDKPLKLDDGEYLLSWETCNVFFGKCSFVSVPQGSINVASSLGPDHSVGYIVFDYKNNTFNYLSGNNMPEDKDNLVLIAILNNHGKDIVFSTTEVLDDVGDPLTKTEILEKNIGKVSDEADSNGTIYGRLKYILSKFPQRYNSELVMGLQQGSTVDEALNVNGNVLLPSPGDILVNDGQSAGSRINGIVVSSSVFQTKHSFSYIASSTLTTVTYNSQTNLVTGISDSYIGEIGTPDDEADASGTLFARLKDAENVVVEFDVSTI